MRYLLLFIFLSCKQVGQVKEKTHPATPIVHIFHIKVKQFSDFCLYEIVYTNNNFTTEKEINEAFDISLYNNKVIEQLALFPKVADAVKTASRLTTYEQCEKYNDSIHRQYDSLKMYRTIHPISEHGPQELEECKNIPDIIIH